MLKKFLISLVLVLNLKIVYADLDLQYSFSPGIVGGESVYKTGGTVVSGMVIEDYWFPISKLKFPVFNIGGATTIKASINRWRWVYSYGRYANSNTGDLIDSDYGITHDGRIVDPETLTIYSRSLTSSDYRLHSLDCLYQLKKTKTSETLIGINVRSDKLYFKSKNTYQTYPGSPEISGDYVDGDTITYEVMTYIPSFLVQYITFYNKTSLDTTVGFSPVAYSREVDDHLVRGRRSEGNGNGVSVFLRSQFNYFIYDGGVLFASVSVSHTSLSGRYKNWFYDDADPGEFSIDFESYNTLYAIGIGYTHLF